MIKMRSLLAASILLIIITSHAVTVPPLKLWYTQPAKKWDTEALPIGNGRMGAMLFGDTVFIAACCNRK